MTTPGKFERGDTDVPRSAEQTSSVPFYPAAALLLALLLVIGFFVFMRSAASGSDADQAVEVLASPSPTVTSTPSPTLTTTPMATETPTSTPTVAPTPTAVCRSATYWLDQIIWFEVRNRWAEAASTAEIALSDPDLCSDEDQRKLLEARLVNDGLESLYYEEFRPTDLLSQQQRAEHYQLYKARATRAGVDFPSDANIGLRARSFGKHYLSLVAYAAAFTSGELTVNDRDAVQTYISAMHDVAVWRLQLPESPARDEAYRYLVTCHLLDTQISIGLGACIGVLEAELPDPSTYPEPMPSPLLDSD